jgi:hypothetical protein
MRMAEGADAVLEGYVEPVPGDSFLNRYRISNQGRAFGARLIQAARDVEPYGAGRTTRTHLPWN